MSKFSWQAIVAGVGGQGVLFVTRILAGAAGKKSNKVLISEVHGMAQRGGSVISHLKAGPFSSPLVTLGQAELVISLEAGEAVRNLPFLAKGGRLVVNAPNGDWLSPEGQKALKRHQIETLVVDASGLAFSVGAPRAANVVMLAAAAAGGALPFTPDQIWAQLEAVSPPARLDGNKKLFELGAG